MKKFSLVTPVYPPSEKVLKRAIDSILNQRDYDNWEMIVVFDGENKEGEQIMSSFNDPRIRHITIEHGGACAARNAGAKLATGDYIAFFSSDFVANPGMFTTWAKAFDDNPDCGFVYGDYDILNIDTGVSLGVMRSQEFNFRQLQTANYIDGGFPLRKEVYKEWDVNCKSLNDWEFWLNICKDGVKGKYLGTDVRTYGADAPKQGGLSYDSSANWLERVDYIKKKHNIPQRDICVMSAGAPYHAQKLAELIDADYLQVPAYKPHKYKMIYVLGLYMTSLDHTINAAFAGSGMEAVKAVHWIGTDVYYLNMPKVYDFRRFKSLIANKIDYHLAEYRYTQAELEALGIKSHYGKMPILPLPVKFDDKEVPLPEKFTVAVYMPQTPDSDWKYCQYFMNDIARALPDIKFIYFGGNKGEDNNIEGMGWVPMEEVIKKSSVLIRMTQHDGLPISAVEFLMKGRQVITNTPIPYTEWFSTLGDLSMNKTTPDNYCETKDRMINRIRRLQKGYGSLKYDWDKIKAYWKDYCDPEFFKAQLNNMLYGKPIEEKPVVDVYYKAGSEFKGMYDNLIV